MNTSTSGRQRLPLLLAVLLLAGVASLGSADAIDESGGIPTRALKHATGPITALVMDGPRVVFSTDGKRVYLWNVQTGTARIVKAPAASAFPLVQEVAIAGQRVAWITRRVAGNWIRRPTRISTPPRSTEQQGARSRTPIGTGAPPAQIKQRAGSGTATGSPGSPAGAA